MADESRHACDGADDDEWCQATQVASLNWFGQGQCHHQDGCSGNCRCNPQSPDGQDGWCADDREGDKTDGRWPASPGWRFGTAGHVTEGGEDGSGPCGKGCTLVRGHAAITEWEPDRGTHAGGDGQPRDDRDGESGTSRGDTTPEARSVMANPECSGEVAGEGKKAAVVNGRTTKGQEGVANPLDPPPPGIGGVHG